VKYAYFLADSDTLLLALRNTASKVLADTPNRFMLFDCAKNTLIDTIDLNQSDYMNYALYDKDFLNSTTYSHRDSYKVRRLASGDLLVPCLDNSSLGKKGKGTLRIETKSQKKPPLILVSNSQFSISTSPDNRRFMYCVENKNHFEFKIHNDTDRSTTLFKSIPTSSFEGNGVGVFADFTEDNCLVFSQNSILYLIKNGNVKEFPSSDPLTTVFSGNQSNYLLASDINNRYAYLIDQGANVPARRIKATIIGYDFNSQTFISQEKVIVKDTSKASYGNANEMSHLVAHSFVEREPRMKVEKVVESTKFNPQTGCILVKARQSLASSLQLLYLYDNSLSLRASFYITPNDTYDFSKSGKNFYIVRDKELLVFDNKVGADLTSFDPVNKMLESEKNASSYKAKIDSLLSKYENQ
jgi:hypothetical protein